MTPTETSVPKAGSKRFRRLRQILGFGLIAAVLLFFLLPVLLSMGFVRTAVEDSLSDNLGVEVTIEDHSVGWFSPLEVKGLRVAQPPGTISDGPLFALQDASFELSLAEIAMGRVRLEGRVLRPELRVVQHEDGTTNLDEIGKKGKTVQVDDEDRPDRDEGRKDDREGDEDDDDESLADRIRKHRIEFDVVDGFIAIDHDVHGVLERLTDLNVRIEKPEDATRFTATLDAAVHRTSGEQGRLALRVEWDADPSQPMVARVDCDEFDLGNYEALLRALLGEREVQTFRGVVTAHTRIESKPGEELDSNGQIRIDGLHLRGESFADLDIQAKRFQFVPAMKARIDSEGRLTELDLDGMEFDLGVLRLVGLATEGEGTQAMPGLRFSFDLDGLSAFGGPMPASLRGTGARLDGTLRLPLSTIGGEFEVWNLVRSIVADASFGLDRFELQDQVLESIAADLSIAGGRVQLETREGRFSGGALSLSMDVDASDPESVAGFDASLSVNGSHVVGRAVEGLRYVMPLLSGIEEATGFRSGLDCELSLAGPLMPQEGEGTIAWISRMAGRGEVDMGGGRFTPAGPLLPIAKVIGQEGRSQLVFESFHAAVELAGGFLTPSSMSWDCGDRVFPLVGRTGVDGSLDYVIDVRDWLRGHRDGEKLLQFLGDEPLGAKLAGSVDEPTLGLPSLEDLLRSAADRAIREQGADAIRRALGGSEFEGVVDEVLGPILGGNRRGEGGDDSPPTIEDILRGVIRNNPNRNEPPPDRQGGSGGDQPPEGTPREEPQQPIDPLEILRRLRRRG